MEGTKGDVSVCLKIYKELPALQKENDTVTLVINSLVFLPRVPEPLRVQHIQIVSLGSASPWVALSQKEPCGATLSYESTDLVRTGPSDHKAKLGNSLLCGLLRGRVGSRRPPLGARPRPLLPGSPCLLAVSDQA